MPLRGCVLYVVGADVLSQSNHHHPPSQIPFLWRQNHLVRQRFSAEVTPILVVKSFFRFLTRKQVWPDLKAPALLNLGCGNHFHSDWVNVDFCERPPHVLGHDLRQPLPLPAESCTVVYHSHVLEHFSREMAPAFLHECFRVLSPGGTLRVVVPDLETIVRLYLRYLEGALSGETGAAERYEWVMLELLDQLVREESGGGMLRYWEQNPMPAEDFVIQRLGWEVTRMIEQLRRHPIKPRRAPSRRQVSAFRDSGELHKWMYDRLSLAALLRRAGFKEPVVTTAADSRIPGFARYCLDTNPDGTVRKPDSLFMEAVKP